MENLLKIELHPYTETDCLRLVEHCQYAFGNASDDRWRKQEWPFANKQAALGELASLSLQHGPQPTPSAYAIGAFYEHSYDTAGLITLSYADFQDHYAWIGTYIAPPYRGMGLQRKAKELIFKSLPITIQGLYGSIDTDNEPSLRAARKLPYCQFINREQLAYHPAPVRKEYHRQQGAVQIVFYHLGALRV